MPKQTFLTKLLLSLFNNNIWEVMDLKTSKSFICVLFAMVLMTLGATECLAMEKVTVGVLNIRSPHGQVAATVADTLTTDIAKIKSLNVVERTELNRVFAERALNDDGIVAQLADGSGRAMGLNYVLIGSANASVNRSYNNYSKQYETRSVVVVNLKLVDAYNEIGKIIWSGQRTVERDGDVVLAAAEEAAYDMARQMYTLFPVQGYVVKLSPGKIYVDLGREAGVKKGDKLRVEGVKETFVHPVTGKQIVTKDVIGKLKVTEVFDDFSVVEMESDEPFKLYPGDIVKREICRKPSGFLGIGWSGAHEF